MNAPSFGTVLLLGVVFAPLYLMLIGWFAGRPRQLRPVLVGVGFLVGLTAMAWIGMAVFALVLNLVFFS
ncbi:MAG: hypothetical protein R3320_00585 [Nitriliruptorales bacterium]|nr:hypothetical protein [Nitriliruptorales bacterium]